MHATIAELLKRAPVLLDGAWGTELQARGLEVGECPDRWNLTHPERVEAVAKAYVAAGSEIILTNTFGANRFILERHGLADSAAEIARTGAAISRRAAGDKARVFGSMGPSGRMLAMDEVSEDDLLTTFELQAEALAEGGVDGIVIETMAEIAEQTIAIRAATATGLPVVACMAYDAGASHDHTMMGVTPEAAAEAAAKAGADVVGANCGSGIEDYVRLGARLRAATSLPIWIKPNAGMPELINGKAVYRMAADAFADFYPELREAGADFIGGCCGTSPAFISALLERMERA